MSSHAIALGLNKTSFKVVARNSTSQKKKLSVRVNLIFRDIDGHANCVMRSD